MKLKIIYFSFMLLCLSALFLNYQDGPAGAEQEDRTGGPFSEAPCQTCHFSGAFSPQLTVELLDNGNAVTEYEAGKTYTLRATIDADDAAEVFGFQALLLKDSDNSNAGSFEEAPDGMQVIEFDGRQYAEHSMPNSDNFFEIEWTAPTSGTGTVNIYAACVAGNDNDLSTGDGSVYLVDPLALTELVTDAEDLIPAVAQLRVLGNPTREQLRLNIEVNETGVYQLNIVAFSGQVVQTQQRSLVVGENLETVDLSLLSAGTYFVQVVQGKTSGTKKFVKI